MTRILDHYRLSEYGEVFILITLGMMLQSVDGSPFSLKERWKSVWDLEIPKEFFSVFAQHFIKTVLSLIVVARCSTTYLYVLSSLLVIACILTNGSPKLLLPWLLIAGIKSIGLTLFETIIGVYVCGSFKKIEVACIEFILQKAVEMLFSSFLWISVLHIHNTMVTVGPPAPALGEEQLTQETLKRADLRRRRARSLLDETTLQKTAKLNYFEFKDVPKILLDMLKKEEDLSQDSLITQGMMLASVSNMGSFDNLKTSQSLGELGSIDLKTLHVVGLDENNEPPTEKALKFMKLTWNDVNSARKKRRRSLSDVHRIDESTWEEVSKTKLTLNRPKRIRAEEVFVRDFDRDKEPVKRGKRRRTRSKSIESKAVDSEGEEDFIEEGNGSTQVSMSEAEENLSRYILMSNLKEEDKVFRIRLESAIQIRKGNKYEELYRQPYMSVIGPEVFDNACKLKPLHYDRREEEEETLQNIIERDDDGEGRRKDRSSSRKKKKSIYFWTEMDQMTSSDGRNATYTPGTSILRNGEREDGGEDDNAEARAEDGGNATVSSRENGSCDIEEVAMLDVDEYLGEIDGKRSVSLIFNEGICVYKKSNSAVKYDSEEESIFMGNVEESNQKISELLDDFLANESALNLIEDDAHKESQTGFLAKISESLDEMKLSDDAIYKEEKYLSDILAKESVTWVTNNTNEDAPGQGKESLNNFLGRLEEINSSEFTAYEIEEFLNDFIIQDSRSLDETNPKEESENSIQSRSMEVSFSRNSTENGSGTSILIESNPSSNLSSTSGRKINLVISKTASEILRKTQNEGKDNEKKIKIIIKRNDSTEGDSNNSSKKGDPQIYFVTEIVKNPLSSVLRNLCDLESSCSDRKWRSTPLKAADEVRPFEISSNDNSACCNKNPSEGSHSFSSEFLSSTKSDESFSLYYSKTADLTSPIFDVRRFIYPDRIHYSYENMKEKGFDVEIKHNARGLPLLIRESLTFDTCYSKRAPEVPESKLKITKKPMNLSFAFFGEDYGLLTSDTDSNEKELTTETLDDDDSAFEECIDVEIDRAKRIYEKLSKLNSKGSCNVVNKFLKNYLQNRRNHKAR